MRGIPQRSAAQEAVVVHLLIRSAASRQVRLSINPEQIPSHVFGLGGGDEWVEFSCQNKGFSIIWSGI